jgi:DNA polymerase-3 subunit delta
MIAVFYGADEFSASEALAELKAELAAADPLGEGPAVIDGTTAKPDELLAKCQTMPFLGSQRLIVVEGLLGRFEPASGRRGGRGRSAGALGPWEAFAESLDALPESTTLAFLDGPLTATNPLFAAVRPHADVREFPALKKGDLAGWIRQRATRYELDMDGRAIALLKELVAPDQLRLVDSELRKLATYAGDRKVSEDDVRELVSLAVETKVFALADAVIEGRTQEAQDVLQRLFADGQPAPMLLFMLTRQYRHLLLAKDLLERGVRAPEVGGQLGIPGFAAQRLLQQAPRYSGENLRWAYHRLLEADRGIKTGVYDDQTALQLLVFELANAAATPQRGRPGYSTPPDVGGRRR